MGSWVQFRSVGRRVRVSRGTRILDAARAAGVPLASGCGASGTCGRCGITVVTGAGSLSAETPAERRVKLANRIDPSQRLSCMTAIEGDVEISAPYW